MKTDVAEAGARPDAQLARPTRQSVSRAAAQSIGITTFLVVLVVAFSLLSEDFLTYDNVVTILASVAFIGIVALGQTLVIISGGFDLSVGGVAPLAAVVYAKAANGGMGTVGAVAVTLCVGATVGLANGLIVTKGHINPLITTLATLSIASGAALALSNGESIPLDDIAFGALAEQSIGDIPNHVWIMLALVVLGAIVLDRTAFGRSLYALGGNREASWLAGSRVDALGTAVYAISGTLAALGGVTLASQLLAGDASLGADAALVSIAAVILGGGSLRGGVGGALGTLAGVLVLGTLSDGLTLLHVNSFYQQMATGGVLLLAVGFSQLRSRISEQ